MNKKILIIVFLLISGFAFSQTTVNLEDQCNCEVLSGTAVTAPGMITPAGADTGDIYVNTNTGTIYFWDGDTWELTATDDQQLQNFSFNSGTNMLSLDIEDGNSVTVDLSSLSNTGTDDQDATEVNLNGPLDVDGDGNNETTVQEAITDLAAITETVTNLVDNNNGTITYTNEDGTPQTINKSDLTDNLDGTYTFDNGDGAPITFVGTDNQDATEVNLNGPIDVDGDGNDETTVQEAIADLAAITETVTNLVDNNDGTITYFNEDGTPQTINKADLTDNLDGTFTFDNGNGVPVIFVGTDDQDANEVNYDNTTSGLVATEVQAAIDEINAAAGTVALVDNGDGTYDFTDASGAVTIISDTSVSTLADNGNGTYTYTDETGAIQNIDTNASSNPYDNTTSLLTATNVQAAIDEINAAAGTVALVDNGDGTYDFTDASGAVTIISDTSVSTLADNGNGTYTYTDETGAIQNIDTNASSNPYDNTISLLTATNVQAAIDEINAAAGTVALVDNLDGTYDFTDASGAVTTISDTSVSTLADNGDGTYTYTDETGAIQNIDTNASSNPYDNTTSLLTATNVQAAIDEINAAAGTVALVDNGDGTYDFTDASGAVTTISDTSVSTLADNGDGTYTYTDETGAIQNIDTNASSNPYDNTTSLLTATNVQAAIDEINAAAGTVALVDNGDGTYDFTDASGAVTTISDTSVSTLADNGDGTYTYTDETGAIQNIDTNASSNPYDNTTSLLTATNVQAAIDEINAAAGTVALVDNGDGTYDFTDASGAVTIISDTSVSTLADNGDGTYTYTDETGAIQNIDTNASSNPYDNTTSLLTATNVQAAIDEINAAAGTVALVDNGDGTYDFTDASGAVTIISDTSVSTLADNGDGTYTYTDETGAIQNIDTNASSNPYDNTTSLLTATNVQAAIDEINAAAGTVALVDNLDGTYEFTDAAGNTTTISDTSISTLSAPVNGVYTYTDESGATQAIDTNASSNPYDNTTSLLTATNVQAAIDEINAAAGTVALVDNLDGTYEFTDAAGNTTTISDTSISTLSAPVNGVYTYTDETGATQNIDTNASSNPYDNTTSLLTATNVQAAIDEINAAAGTVALVDNGDGTYDFTDAAGNTTTISDTSISTLVDNGDGSFTYTAENGAVTIFTETLTSLVDNANGTFTYTNEDGVAQTINKSDIINNFDGTYVFTNNDGSNETIDTNASSNPYDNTTSLLTATTVQEAIDELNTGSTDDQNISGSVLTGTDLTIGIENGTSEDVDLSSLVETVIAGTGAITVTDDGNGNYTVNSTDPDEDLTNELTLIGAGAPAVTPSNAGVTYVDNVAGQLYVYDGAAWQQVGGSASPDLDPDPTNEIQDLDLTGDILTITNNGSATPIDLSGYTDTDTQDLSIDGTGKIISLVDGGSVTINSDDADADPTNEYNTGIGFDGTNLTITDGGGNQTIDISAVSTDTQDLSIDGAGTTISLVDGGNVTINPDDADADPTNEYNTGVSFDGTNLTVTDAGGNQSVDISALDTNTTNTSLTEDGTNLILTDSDTNTVTIPLADIGTDTQDLSIDLAGTTISLVDGGNVTINPDDADADPTNEYNTAVSFDGTNLMVTDAGGNQSVDISALDTDDQDLSNSIVTANESVEIQITDGNNTTIDIRDADSDVTNELTLIGSGAPAVTPSNSGVTYVDDVAGQLYVYDGAIWNAVGGNASPDLDGDPTNEYNTGVSFDGTNLTVTDAGGNQSVDISALDTDTQDLSIDGTGKIISLVDGGSVTINSDDADADPTNEYNTGIGFDGTNLTVTDAGGNQSVDISALDTNTTNTSLTEDGTNLILTDSDTNTVTIPLADIGTDTQDLSIDLAGTTISLVDGGNVTINPDDADADPTNEYNTGVSFDGTNLTVTDAGGNQSVDISALDTDTQDLSIDGTGKIISLVDGGSVTINADDADANPTNEIQDLDLTGDILTITNNGSATPIDLSGYTDTDTQDLSIDGTGKIISLVDGGSVTINADDADADPTNEYNTGIGFDGTNLTVTDAGGNQSVDISALGVDTNTTNTSLTEDGTNLILTDSDTNTVTIPLADIGSDTQDLSIDGTGKIISLVDGGSVTINADDADANPTNEIQDLDLTGDILTITNNGSATPIDLSGYTDTDTQDLSIDGTGKIISLVDGGSVTINADDADADPTNEYNTGIGFDGTNLTVTDAGGNQSVDISALGVDTNTTNTSLTEDGTNLILTDSDTNTVTIPLADIGTDTQDLSIDVAGTTISLVDGGSVTVNVDDADAVIGNEVVNGTDATLTRSGSGTNADPYTLDVAADGITNAEIADDAVQLENIANGTANGQVIQWDGSDWTLVDLGSVTVTENDGVIGNEIVNGTDGTLVRSGAGTTVSPFTLDIAADGITNAELSDNAVQLENVADGTAVGQIMQWNGTDWVLVNGSALNTDTQDLSIDGTGKIISLVDGGSVTINSDDADADPTNEYNTGIGFDGTNLTVTDAGGNQSVDISALGVDTNTTNTSLTEDGTNLILTDSDTNTVTIPLADIGTDTQDLSIDVAGTTISLVDGGSVTVNVDDADSVIGNEYNTAFSVVGPNLRLTDGGGDFDVPLTSLGTDTQDLSIDGTGKIISLVDGGSVTINSDDADADPTNEYNTAVSFDGTNLTVTDAGGNQSVDISALDTDTQDLSIDGTGKIISLVDGGSVTINSDDADADPTNEYNTGIGFDGTNLTVTDAGGNQSVDISALGVDTNTTNTSLTEDGTNLILTDSDTNTVTIPLADIGTDTQDLSIDLAGTTISLVDGGSVTVNVDDADAVIGNEYNTAFSVVGPNLRLTDGGGDFDVPLTSLGTDTQDLSIDGTGKIISLVDGGSVTINSDDADANPTNEIQDLDLTGDILTITNNGSATPIDLSGYTDTDTQDLSIDGTGKIISLVDGGSVTINSDDADADPTNEYNTGIGFDGTNLTVTDAGGNQSVDISALDTDTQDLSIDGTGKIISLVDGGSVTINSDDADADPTNEYNTGIGFDGTNLTVTDAGGNQSVDISALGVDTNTTNTSLTEDGTNLILTDSDTNTVTIPLADIGTDTQDLSIDVAGTTISLVDGGSVTVNVDDADSVIGNEYNTAFSVVGPNLRLTDGGGDFDVPLTSLGTDTQDLSIDGTGKIISLVDGGSVTINADDADADPTNEYNTAVSFDGTNLTVTDAGGNQSVDISALDTDTQDLSIDGTGKIISLVDGGSVTINSDDADADPTNEYNTGIGFDGTNLTVTDAGGNQSVDISALGVDTNTTNTSLTEDGTNLILTDSDTNTVTIPLADIGTDTQDLSIDVAGTTISLVDGGSVTVNVDDADAVIGNEYNTAFSVVGPNLRLTDGGGDFDVPLTSLGTDTQDLSIDGTGKIISLVDGGSVTINSDDADADPTNEYNTAVSFDGTNLTVTDAGGNQSVDISALDTDTQDLSIDGTGKIISLVDGGSVTINSDDADADPTNEYNTGIGFDGTNLTVTDAGGNQSVDISALGVDTNTTNTSLTEDGTNLILTDSDTNTVTIPLADLGTDDQYDDEVLLRTAIDVDDAEKSVAQGYVEETTVQEVINAIAPITSKAARIFYPPSIAIDASTNGTFSIDLYQEYIDQYGSPTVGSTSAPAALPTYGRTELYYYVTYADTSVFGNGTTVLNMSIDDNGNLSYEVFNQPADYNSLINVVFVVK